MQNVRMKNMEIYQRVVVGSSVGTIPESVFRNSMKVRTLFQLLSGMAYGRSTQHTDLHCYKKLSKYETDAYLDSGIRHEIRQVQHFGKSSERSFVK
jgi:hypothetical protein